LSDQLSILIAGATGFIGGRLVSELAKSGHAVRCLVRDPSRASDLRSTGHEVCQGDLLDADSIQGAARGVDVAYYLVHSMGRGGANGSDFADRDRRAAHNFASLARDEGVGRVIYLGGLGDESSSKHLRSRHETAEILAADGPPLTYLRAAMVVGSQSESFRTLRYLVARLPVMIAPSWLRTRTQPVGIDDTIAYLGQAPGVPESTGREVQIGGPDILSYGDMLGVMAEVMDKRPRPMLPVPLLSPGLSALWLGLITPVDTGVARPLVEGLRTPTVVTDPAGAHLFDVEPTPFRETLRRALAEEEAGG
jgi:uncharacterized protein YbjT (DUF2867 family)